MKGLLGQPEGTLVAASLKRHFQCNLILSSAAKSNNIWICNCNLFSCTFLGDFFFLKRTFKIISSQSKKEKRKQTNLPPKPLFPTLYALLSQSTEQTPRDKNVYVNIYICKHRLFDCTFVKWLLSAEVVICPVGVAQRNNTKTLLPPDCSWNWGT